MDIYRLSGFQLVTASIAFLPILILAVFVLVVGSAIERFRYGP